MGSNEVSIEELIETETEKRLEEMENPGYEFPKQITNVDGVAMAVLFFGSLLLIVLCMTGVIQ